MASKRNIIKNPPPVDLPPIPEPEEKKPRAKKEKRNKEKHEVAEEEETAPKRDWLAFTRDERFQKIAGAFFLLFSFYLLIAFASFVFTWKADQDKVDAYGFFGLIFSSNELTVENWLGKMGAAISHLFIHKGFGLASFIFVLNFFVFGIKILTGISLLPLKRMIRTSFLLLVLSSVALAFLFQSSSLNLFIGGGFGYHVNQWLIALVGKIGTLLFIGFAVIAAFIFYFNPSLKKKNNEVKTGEEEIAEEQTANKIKIKSTILPDENPKEEHYGFVDEYDEDFSKYELKKKENLTAEDEDDIIETYEQSENRRAEVEEIKEDQENILSAEITNEISAVEEIPSEEGFSIEVNRGVVDESLSDEEINAKLEEFGEYDPTLDLSSYKLPSINELENYTGSGTGVSKEELETNKNRILQTLKNYDIDIAQIKATIGPTVTLYEIVPAPGVRISKIKNLEDDIALSLSALGIRIIAPIPGKGTIGIEVPNSKAETVSMRSLIGSDKFLNTEMDLPVALGKTIQNEVFVADLTKMPHLLMAGATGQGKSVGLNAILVSILYKKHPSQVKFVLVDPKKVELTLFNKIERHFLAKLPDSDEAIITNNQKVIHTLNSLCIEMDLRYELLKDAGVRNIKEYNTKFIQRKLLPTNGHHFLPYIVLVVDEFADLIMTAGKEVETPIARLAQLARAIGIHLIIATQRPSVNVITGTIKANFPARIAFRVTSKIDSRTILDSGGAEQLIGRGDMIFSTGNELIRIQCGFVDTPEVERICEFIGSQRAYPSAFMLPEYVDENAEESGGGNLSLDDQDELFEEAARIIVTNQQGSASLLQRKLKLGYNRAGRLVDQLEAAGVIGPFKGSKAREVLIQDLSSLEQFLNNRKAN